MKYPPKYTINIKYEERNVNTGYFDVIEHTLRSVCYDLALGFAF